MGSWIGRILGTDKAAGDLTQAKQQADTALQTGYTTGRADVQGGIDRLNPIATGGQDAYSRLLDSLGVHGAGAQGGVEGEYMADPIQNALMDRITKANTRAYTARGMNNSGAATTSLTNNLLENWRAYQTQLGTAAAPGIAATGQQATLQKDQGDMAYGYGATQAGNDINYGNALAKNRTYGANFIGGLAGTALQAAGSAFGRGGRTASAGGSA